MVTSRTLEFSKSFILGGESKGVKNHPVRSLGDVASAIGVLAKNRNDFIGARVQRKKREAAGRARLDKTTPFRPDFRGFLRCICGQVGSPSPFSRAIWS